MIDQDKMRALAKTLRAWNWRNNPLPNQAADAIDLLLAEVEAANMQLTVPDWAEGDDQAWDKVTPAVAWHLIERHGENWAHIGRMMQAYLDAHTATLRAELEAAAADKRDGHRYRELLGLLLAGDIPMLESSVSLNVCGVPPNQDEFDEAVDFLLAQRQGEGS
ncbi:hypothetical protein ABWH74_002614 [Burkholderia vietnamiensis]